MRASEFRVKLVLIVEVGLKKLNFMFRDGRYSPERGAIGARKAGGSVVKRLAESAAASSEATATTKASASGSTTSVASTPKAYAVTAPLLTVVPGKIKKCFVLLQLFVLVVRLLWGPVFRPIQSNV